MHTLKQLLKSLLLRLLLLLGWISVPWAKMQETLYVYAWSEYIPVEIVDLFLKETGIRVIVSTYDSNETLFLKLKTQLSKECYDLIIPSSYFLQKLKHAQMLRPINHQLLPNLKNINPFFLNQSFDPSNQFSVPYIWGATAIGLNTRWIDPQSVTAWKDLWNQEYKRKVLLLDDAREVLAISLLTLHDSVNTTDPKVIAQAAQKLESLIPNILLFNSDFPAGPYLEEEAMLGMLWNGAAYLATQENPTITLKWPEEGAIAWMDCLAIPQHAKNVQNAHRFINFLLRADVAARIAERIGYSTPNAAAHGLLPDPMKNHPFLYPEQAVLAKVHWLTDLGPATLFYETAYRKLRSQ